MTMVPSTLLMITSAMIFNVPLSLDPARWALAIAIGHRFAASALGTSGSHIGMRENKHQRKQSAY